MGSFFSSPVSKTRAREHCEVSQAESRKRQKMASSFYDDNPRLFPGLPDEISLQILARLPRIHYLRAKLVSRTWKDAITSPQIFEVRRELGVTEQWMYILANEEDKFMWHALDPLSGKWQRLPRMPSAAYEEECKSGLSGFRGWNVMRPRIKVVDVIRGWLGKYTAVDQMHLFGCSVGAVYGCLYVLGGFSKATALNTVWRYDPRFNSWQEVSPMIIARAFCKTALLNNKLYVVGGVSRGRGGISPLRSSEVFDPCTGVWTQLPCMPFSKADALPAAFLADMLKPIATGMASYRDRLCVTQSLYAWPFFVDIGGEVYDPETGLWADMPAGMAEGWPAKQAGTKLSVIVDGELYSLDPTSSLDDGKIKIYDTQEDAWKVIIPKVPVLDFITPECPYLLSYFHGKLHVITRDANNDIAVLQADLPKHAVSSPSASSASPLRNDNMASSSEEASDLWKVVAAKNFGPAELIACQVLDI